MGFQMCRKPVEKKPSDSPAPPVSVQVQLLPGVFWTYSKKEKNLFDSMIWKFSLIRHPAGNT